MADFPELLRISAAISREQYEKKSIEAWDRGDCALAEIYGDMAWLTSLTESELELGVEGDVVQPARAA